MDISAVTGNAAAQTGQARSSLSGNFDTFLKLLTTQLQHQDPLEPLDSTKFTEQLVAYSQVEQQINTNTNLAALLAVATTSLGANAVSYLGKTALTSDPLASLANGAAEWRYKVPEGAATVQLSITDQNGSIVRTITGESAAGDHDFAWDGLNAAGNPAADGVYRLSVVVKDVAGGDLTAAVNGIGLVKEIDMSGTEPFLTIGARRVGLTNIIGFKN